MKRPSIFKGAERQGADMTLSDHIRELRYRLLVSVGAIFVGMIPAWFLYNPLLNMLNTPYCTALTNVDVAARCDFFSINLLDPFALRLKVAGYGGVFLAMPVILWQLWRFLAPGLYKRERRYALAFTVSAFLLFTFGAFVAYFTLNQAVQFLVRVGGPDIEIRSGPNEFVKLSLFMMLAFGAGFLFPLVLVALQMIGVVTPQKLSSWRRQIILIIVVVAAVITPSGDPISLAALSVPMYIFFEVAVLLGRLMARRKGNSGSSEPSEAMA
ncbi:MAG: twin-arginine translocase subunit TatC [Microthrixaceae bacterium]